MFLPMTLPKTQLTSPSSSSNVNSKGKGPIHLPRTHPDAMLHLSQKALFLALYAKYMSGEKRKDEESEMILGPADGGPTINKELVGISTILQARLNSVEDGQGWLEYLYGIVLSKGKNQEQAKQWLVKSVHSYSFNWGAWQELGSLLGSTDDVSGRNTLENVSVVLYQAATNDPASSPTKYHGIHIPHISKTGTFPL